MWTSTPPSSAQARGERTLRSLARRRKHESDYRLAIGPHFALDAIGLKPSLSSQLNDRIVKRPSGDVHGLAPLQARTTSGFTSIVSEGRTPFVRGAWRNQHRDHELPTAVDFGVHAGLRKALPFGQVIDLPHQCPQPEGQVHMGTFVQYSLAVKPRWEALGGTSFISMS